MVAGVEMPQESFGFEQHAGLHINANAKAATGPPAMKLRINPAMRVAIAANTTPAHFSVDAIQMWHHHHGHRIKIDRCRQRHADAGKS